MPQPDGALGQRQQLLVVALGQDRTEPCQIPVGELVDTADAGKRSRRNAVVGVGVGLAALALIAAASQSKKAYAGERSYSRNGYGGGQNYCGRLLRKCNNGSNWACEKYETGGCTE